MSYRQIEAYCAGVDQRWERLTSLLAWVIAGVNNVHLKRGHKVKPEHYFKPKKRTLDDDDDDTRIEAEAETVATAIETRRAPEPEPVLRSEKERKAYARAKVRRLREEQRAKASAAARRERALALRQEAREYWQTPEGAELDKTLRELFG